MALPPFPFQDLAKLVLGYLAQEQLMTAYDEFLQASPYLDAHSNEYDRIFMTSLKSILADYRAVRIYVETCKPLSLRRRLIGCANLLDIVKFLVQNVDLAKINISQSIHHKTSEDSTVLSKTTSCEVCASLKLSSCNCKPRHTSQQSGYEEAAESSVEATALEDLPGNQGTKPKRSGDNESQSQSHAMLSNYNDNVPQSVQGGNAHFNANQHLVNNSSLHSHGVVNRKPVQESSEVNRGPSDSNVNLTDINKNNYSTSTAGSFHEFVKGVDDGSNNQICMNVPDSSTLDNNNLIQPTNKEANSSTTDNRSNLKEVSNAQIFLKVGTVSSLHREANMTRYSNSHLQKILPQPEQKVTILSDIKVDKTYVPNDSDMPLVLKNATSTPMMQLQTVMINGTPVYKQQNHPVGTNVNYSTDEIMAMPTIVLVPTSAPSNLTSAIHFTSGVHTSNINPSFIQPIKARIATTSTVTQSTLNVNTFSNNQRTVSDISLVSMNENQVKVLENKNATVPKDIVDFPRTTPETQPPTRKASSTPRRTSHVRILDFSTPRRILEDTIPEQIDNITDIVVSKSPNLHTLSTNPDVKETVPIGNKNKIKVVKTGLNTPGFVKKTNWDEDLRTLACANQENLPLPPKPKRKHTKKKTIEIGDVDGQITKPVKATAKKKSTNNVVAAKSKNKSKQMDGNSEEVFLNPPVPPVPPVKPTINIITNSDWITEDKPLNKSNSNEIIEIETQTKCNSNEIIELQNKNNSNEIIETPEMERTCLENPIDANRSLAFLDYTPFKQVLKDLQMDTPKFLNNPHVPPASLNKILDMPTPKDLASPKISQTPSSYSSRPTDYSSGGSYYKPDDYDTILPDLTPATSIKETTEILQSTTITISQVCPKNDDITDNIDKTLEPSRPVRKCTKNVSYYNSPIIKAKGTEETAKQSANVNNSNNKLTPKPRQNKKKPTTAKKKKTPVKKEATKSFVKIKPRRVTPTKSVEKTKKVLPISEGRKRTSSKEKSLVVTPAPTKSRRKSSTPRKLHSTSTSYASESSGHESPVTVLTLNDNESDRQSELVPQDSDNEELPLRWSDEGSQETKSKEISVTINACNDDEDIIQIKEYIAKSAESVSVTSEVNSELNHGAFRGFNEQSAKSIEQDLLDESSKMETVAKIAEHIIQVASVEVKRVEQELKDKSDDSNLNKSEDDIEADEIELSVHECNEDTENYIQCNHEQTQNIPTRNIDRLKEKFSMEVCLDEDEVIRLRATPFSLLFDLDANKEIEAAVNSISNIQRLYTPMKDSLRRQVYDIFDSTLTSLDTPLKADSPDKSDVNITVTEIVLQVEKVEEENIEIKQKPEHKKRKRAQSGSTSDDANDTKRNKQDHILLDSIKNIDIENVLDKLHGE